MALRRDNNKEKQLNRAGSGRSKARGAGLYDLRYSDQDQPASTWTGQSADLYTFGEELDPTGRNRASGSSQGSYGRTEAEERPYRERHRVEVKETDYTRSRGIVRGNAPAERREAAEPGERREISADMFVSSRPSRRITRRSSAGTDGYSYGSTAGRGGSLRTPAGVNNPGTSYAQPSDTRRGSTNRDREYAQPFDTRRGSTSRDREYAQPTDSWRESISRDRGYAQSFDMRRGSTSRDREYAQPTDSWRGSTSRGREYAQPIDTRRGSTNRDREYAQPFDTRRAATSRENDYARSFTQYQDYSPEDEEWTDSVSDETAEKERRARQRARIRKQREKELRITYIKIGAVAFVFLFAAAFLISTAVRRLPLFSGSHGTAASQEADDSEGILAASGGEESSDEKPSDEKLSDEKTSGENQDTSGQEDAAGRNQAENEDSPADENGAAEDSGENDRETADSDAKDKDAQADEEPEQAAEVSGQQDDLEADAGADVEDEDLLILVNPWNTVPEGYKVETSSLLNGESVDSRCYSDLAAMLQECLAAGGSPIVCSAYRPHEKQVRLYQEQVDSLLAQGRTQEEAEAEAGTVVAVPGTSEHELGLAVDICDSENQNLDESQLETLTQQWLIEHCWDYGFILRYPVDKSEITGIIYEPWHYRYVGRKNAAKIHESGLCLEEYLGKN